MTKSSPHDNRARNDRAYVTRTDRHPLMAAHPFKFLLMASAAVAMLLSPTGQSGLPGLAQAQAQSVVSVGRNTSGSERIMLGLDKSLVIDLPADAHDILVANPAVADAVWRDVARRLGDTSRQQPKIVFE